MATCRLSTPAWRLRMVRSPVARTPGRAKRPSFLKLEVEELAGMGAFVTHDRGLGRFESSETMEAVATQHAGESGFGNIEHGEDLGVGAALSAQSQDVSDELGTGSARLMTRDGGTVWELSWEAGLLCPQEPAADGSFADVVSNGDGPEGKVGRGQMRDHFGSHLWGESGISVHVVRGVWR